MKAKSKRSNPGTTRAANARFRATHPEQVKQTKRASRLKTKREHPERLLLSAAKQRSRRDGTLFTITVDDVRIPRLCPILGVELKSGVGRGKHLDTSPSIDRIVPALGYVPGNVWVISSKANRMKSDATVKEIRLLADALERKHFQMQSHAWFVR